MIALGLVIGIYGGANVALELPTQLLKQLYGMFLLYTSFAGGATPSITYTSVSGPDSTRGARSRKRLSIRVVHRSAGSTTCPSAETKPPVAAADMTASSPEHRRASSATDTAQVRYRGPHGKPGLEPGIGSGNSRPKNEGTTT